MISWQSPAPPLDTVLRAAGKGNRPVAVLVFDFQRGDADLLAAMDFASIASRAGAIPLILNLADSPNRAAAAPLHALEKPTLVCLSPAGVIVSRDEGPIAPTLIRQRIASAIAESPALDAQLATLSAAVTATPTVTARTALADFLLAHHNDREAIPHLKAVADDDSAEVPTRIKALVVLGKSHLWTIEPEKARHAAQALIATLGPRSADAVAGGNLVRGLQDAKAKRFDRARDELRTAVSAAPESTYAREAGELLKTLPAESK